MLDDGNRLSQRAREFFITQDGRFPACWETRHCPAELKRAFACCHAKACSLATSWEFSHREVRSSSGRVHSVKHRAWISVPAVSLDSCRANRDRPVLLPRLGRASRAIKGKDAVESCECGIIRT